MRQRSQEMETRALEAIHDFVTHHRATPETVAGPLDQIALRSMKIMFPFIEFEADETLTSFILIHKGTPVAEWPIRPRHTA